MVEQLETTDIQQQPKQEIKQEETLDQILQSKKLDAKILDKLKPIFEAVQKSFQQPINEYIKGLNTKDLNRIINKEAEPIKYLIEDIEVTTGIPIIDVTKDRKDKVVETTQDKNENETILESRKATKDSYDKLDKEKYPEPKTQQEKEQLASIKNNISEQTKQKLDIQKLDIDTYANFLFTKQKYGDKLKQENNTKFLTNLEKLNDTLGIVPEHTKIKKMNDPDYANNVVTTNENLKTFTETSDKFDKISAPTLPETKDFDTEFTTYVKFIANEDIKKNIEDNKNIIKEYKELHDKYPEEARDLKSKEAYDEYIKAITEIKENLPNTTQTIIKQRVMGSCITGLAKYFDTTTINQDNFSNDFDINTQEGFTIKDDILAIKGDIKGNRVGFYYNLTDPDAQLQSDDFLHFDGVSESFTFGVDGGGKNNLGVKLPTLGLLSDQAQGVSEKNFTALLEKSTSLEDFEAAMKEQVSTELLKNYGQEALVKTRVERDIEKNITAQTLNDIFVPKTILEEMNRDKSINKTTEKKARKLLNIRDKSTENMRSDELRKLRSLTERLDSLITQTDHGKLEPKRQKLLEGIETEKSAVTYNDTRGTATLKFFRRYSDNDKINLQDLDMFVTSLEKKESISENIAKFSPDFQTTEDHEDADGLLENIA